MSNLNLGDTVELYNLKKRLDLNGRLGVICNRSDGERYGIKLDGSIIFSEHVKYMGDVNEVSIDTSTSNRNFWCLDPDCLESTEYFNSNEELDEHMKNHIE